MGPFRDGSRCAWPLGLAIRAHIKQSLLKPSRVLWSGGKKRPALTFRHVRHLFGVARSSFSAKARLLPHAVQYLLRSSLVLASGA